MATIWSLPNIGVAMSRSYKLFLLPSLSFILLFTWETKMPRFQSGCKSTYNIWEYNSFFTIFIHEYWILTDIYIDFNQVPYFEKRRKTRITSIVLYNYGGLYWLNVKIQRFCSNYFYHRFFFVPLHPENKMVLVQIR